MRNKFLYSIIMCFLFLSCNLLDSGPGTGTISVEVGGKKYEASDVTGTEYFGFYCSGKILNKTLGLGLGIAPRTGDTLSFLNKQMISSYDVFVSYNGNYGFKESGKIIITKKSGTVVTGKFFCKILIDKDTVDFSNGYFNVECPASR